MISYTNTVQTVVPHGFTLGGLSISPVARPQRGGDLGHPSDVLQSVDSLNNTWTNVPAAAAPYVTPTATQQFFRLAK